MFFWAHVWCKYLILLAHYITDTDGRTHTLIHTYTDIHRHILTVIDTHRETAQCFTPTQMLTHTEMNTEVYTLTKTLKQRIRHRTRHTNTLKTHTHWQTPIHTERETHTQIHTDRLIQYTPTD